MADLASGRYPDTHEDWVLDGKPARPFRQNFSRRIPFFATGLLATSDTAWVVPVVCQQGDVISKVTIGVKTASATPSYGFAALYTGLTTADTLIAQAPNDTSGFHGSGSAQTFTLSAPHLVGSDPGDTGSSGPVALGVMLYNKATTGGYIDAISVGSEAVAGGVFITGQVPLLFTLATAGFDDTAPDDLSGFAAAAAAYVTPLVILH